jgi:tetratricopeptide (TPR) repeat protein
MQKAVLLVMILGGCAVSPSTPPPEAASQTPAAAPQTETGVATDSVRATPDALWPIRPEWYRTTSGTIYLGNLQARIDSYRRADLRQPRPAGQLAAALYARYRLLGRFEDAVEARDVLQGVLATASPEADPELFMLAARVHSGFHRFEEAERLLGRLPPQAMTAERLALQRDIDVALGRYPRLDADFAASAQPVGEFYELAHRADLRVLLGDLSGAERQYRLAQSLYRDVDPMPLAWLHTQMGIALLRFGQIERARTFFAAAVERLPGYALAEEHLAECETLLGETEAARARYLRVIAQTDNPEFMAALAGLEQDAGRAQEAELWRTRAQARYADLLAAHPAAFAYHAVEFYLELGQLERALDLARENRRLRGDIFSDILLAQAAGQAGETAEACTAWRTAASHRLRPPEWQPFGAESPCAE